MTANFMPPPKSSSSGPAKRPSLRSVAKKAGVSAMTVSRVLRNQPSISEPLRARVMEAVHTLGYTPDPQVAKLMHHLRTRRKPAFEAAICALTTRGPDAPQHHYFEGIANGAAQRAKEVGFSFSTLQIGSTLETWRTLPRVLRSRGVEGAILLPMILPISLDGLLDWDEFSVVAATLSVISPQLHAVLPHHFKNARQLAERISALGYRRIGVVANVEQTQRTNHSLNAAVIWHELLTQGNFVPPLLYSGTNPRNLEDWFHREQPDVIVTHVPRLCHTFAARLGLSIPGPVGFVSANAKPGTEIAGINERPHDVGAAAIDLLASLIHRGVRGIPSLASTTLIAGHWVDAPSCPPRRPTTSKHSLSIGSTAVYLEK
jgi:DNA-binding LacI/PurR family transcriptional regulator